MKRALTSLLLALALVVPASASEQLSKIFSFQLPPLVITVNGTPVPSVVGTQHTFIGVGTNTITTNRDVTVSITAIAGGGGGSNVDVASTDSWGGGGGGQGAYNSTGFAVSLTPGVTYQATVGAGGIVHAASSGTGHGGNTLFRISGSTIFLELQGGRGAGAFSGSVYPGGAGGTVVTGSGTVGGAGGAGGDGGIGPSQNGSNGAASGGGGGGGSGDVAIPGIGGGNGGTSGGGAGGGPGSGTGIGGVGGAGGGPFGNFGYGGGGMGAWAYNATAGGGGWLRVTISSIP